MNEPSSRKQPPENVWALRATERKHSSTFVKIQASTDRWITGCALQASAQLTAAPSAALLEIPPIFTGSVFTVDDTG
jgi:hypothetical protein